MKIQVPLDSTSSNLRKLFWFCLQKRHKVHKVDFSHFSLALQFIHLLNARCFFRKLHGFFSYCDCMALFSSVFLRSLPWGFAAPAAVSTNWAAGELPTGPGSYFLGRPRERCRRFINSASSTIQKLPKSSSYRTKHLCNDKFVRIAFFRRRPRKVQDRKRKGKRRQN